MCSFQSIFFTINLLPPTYPHKTVYACENLFLHNHLAYDEAHTSPHSYSNDHIY